MKEEHALKSACVRPQQEGVNKVNISVLSNISFCKILISFYKKWNLDVKAKAESVYKNAVEIWMKLSVSCSKKGNLKH